VNNIETIRDRLPITYNQTGKGTLMTDDVEAVHAIEDIRTITPTSPRAQAVIKIEAIHTNEAEVALVTVIDTEGRSIAEAEAALTLAVRDTRTPRIAAP